MSQIRVTKGEVTITMAAEEFHTVQAGTVVHYPFRDLLEATLAYAEAVQRALEREGWEGLS